MIRPDTAAGLAEWIMADMAAAPARVALSAMREYMEQWITGAGPALFDQLSLPVVAVCSDRWPVDVEANRRHMRSFEAIVLEGTDHFLMLGGADEFNRALEEAIAKIAPQVACCQVESRAGFHPGRAKPGLPPGPVPGDVHEPVALEPVPAPMDPPHHSRLDPRPRAPLY
jgi:hypothetical protein